LTPRRFPAESEDPALKPPARFVAVRIPTGKVGFTITFGSTEGNASNEAMREVVRRIIMMDDGSWSVEKEISQNPILYPTIFNPNFLRGSRGNRPSKQSNPTDRAKRDDQTSRTKKPRKSSVEDGVHSISRRPIALIPRKYKIDSIQMATRHDRLNSSSLGRGQYNTRE
jgi:hypothetical protein